MRRLVLMVRYLCDNGYVESAERLQTEGQISLSSVDAADNVGLCASFGQGWALESSKKQNAAAQFHAVVPIVCMVVDHGLTVSHV